MQLGILLWKCWIMRRRHYISTFFELLMPLLLGIFLAYRFNRGQPSQYRSQNSYDGNIRPPTPGEQVMAVSRDSIPLFPYKDSYNFTIYYAPNSLFAQNIMHRVRTYCPTCERNNEFITTVGLETAEQVDNRLKMVPSNRYYMRDTAGVIFNSPASAS